MTLSWFVTGADDQPARAKKSTLVPNQGMVRIYGSLERQAGLDLSAFDFDWGLRDELDTSVVEDNYDPVLPADPKSKLGDVYQLGDHRLMCGDSTSLTDVQKLVGGTNGFATHRPPIQCGLSWHRRED